MLRVRNALATVCKAAGFWARMVRGTASESIVGAREADATLTGRTHVREIEIAGRNSWTGVAAMKAMFDGCVPVRLGGGGTR